MTTPVLDEPMYSLAVYPGSAGWFFIADGQRQTGKADPTYKHHLPPGSYMVSATVTGTASMDLLLNTGVTGQPARRIKLAPAGVDGTTRSGSTSISITTTTAYVGFQPTVNFTQAQLDNPITATVQVIKIPSYKHAP